MSLLQLTNEELAARLRQNTTSVINEAVARILLAEDDAHIDLKTWFIRFRVIRTNGKMLDMERDIPANSLLQAKRKIISYVNENLPGATVEFKDNDTSEASS